MTNPYEGNDWFIPPANVTIKRDESLGVGGFGQVYAGHYGPNPVAVKTITGLNDPRARTMAKDEATLWYTLRHPNITLLFGVSVDQENNPLLIIERAKTSLCRRLYDEEPLTKEEKLRWILQIAEAFKYLHAKENPVIHADLNPNNVLIGYDGVAKITDFGLSRFLTVTHTHTTSRQAFGTVRYAPPESFGRRYKATTAHDVYSFGMTVFEILAEVSPFKDATRISDIPLWVQSAERPDSEPDKIPEDSWEWALIEACWDQDPSKRPSFESIVTTILQHTDLPTQVPRTFTGQSVLGFTLPKSPADVAPVEAFRQNGIGKVPRNPFYPDSSSKLSSGSSSSSKLSSGSSSSSNLSSGSSKNIDTSRVLPAYSELHPSDQARQGLMYKYGTSSVPQDYAKAIELLSQAANQGNASAQYELGEMYHQGLGVAQDYSRAFGYYAQAANQGDAAGQNRLGWMYQHRLGVTQDYSKALEWYTRAANQGHSLGQLNLGSMYYYGYGVAQDFAKAFEWFTLAANQGHAMGQYNLGEMCYYGYGVAQDYSKAGEYFTLASNQGNEHARKKLHVVNKQINIKKNLLF
ncbi:kinase-like domain-containing protein [Obelidium mucronatum]|nr:kinase-like domain-containing protein [Obelidium mucronatum]